MSFWGGRLWTHYYAKQAKGQVKHETMFHRALAKQYRGRVMYQFPVPVGGKFLFADFLLIDEKVIIEVDDKSHDKDEKQAQDEAKLALLQHQGYRVLRCTNQEVAADADAVVRNLLGSVGLLSNNEI